MKLSWLIANLETFVETRDPHTPLVVRVLSETWDPLRTEYVPGDVVSYRGVYAEPAISYSTSGKLEATGRYLQYLQDFVKNGVLYGYKGGEYDCNPDKPIWLARDNGDYSQTQIVSITDEKDACVLIAARMETW